jgi:hypothetical protein
MDDMHGNEKGRKRPCFEIPVAFNNRYGGSARLNHSQSVELTVSVLFPDRILNRNITLVP